MRCPTCALRDGLCGFQEAGKLAKEGQKKLSLFSSCVFPRSCSAAFLSSGRLGQLNRFLRQKHLINRGSKSACLTSSGSKTVCLMQPPGCNSLYTNTGGPGCYPPYLQAQRLYSVVPPQGPVDEQSEPSVQTCVRDSVRLLGEAVAVLEGVRLLGSQLMQWGGELHQVLHSFVPVALLLQLFRWIHKRTLGASRRRTLSRMSRAWQEASGGLRPGAKLLIPSSNTSSNLLGLPVGTRRRAGWLSALRDLSAIVALILVAAELYVHLHVYRRLVLRLRSLFSKAPASGAPSANSTKSGDASKSK